jgi:hypothetical protein
VQPAKICRENPNRQHALPEEKSKSSCHEEPRWKGKNFLTGGGKAWIGKPIQMVTGEPPRHQERKSEDRPKTGDSIKAQELQIQWKRKVDTIKQDAKLNLFIEMDTLFL